MDMREAPKTAANAIGFWKYLTDEEKEYAQARMSIVKFKKGQLVRKSSQDCLGMLYIRKGTLRAYIVSDDGQEVTLFRMRKGECCVFTAACVLNALSFESQVDAEADSEALLIPASAFAHLVESNLHVEKDVYMMLTRRFSGLVSRMERLMFFDIEQRLILFLLDESKARESDTVRMTHEQIAVSIGSARAVVSRTLKRLEEKDLVTMFRGGVRLNDHAKLLMVTKK